MKHSEITVQKWSERWLKEQKKYLKESTYANYVYYTQNYIISNIGEKKLCEMDEKEIQKFIYFLLKNGSKKTKRGLSVKTTKHIILLLVKILKDAEQHKKIVIGSMHLKYPESMDSQKQTPILSHKQEQDLFRAIFTNISEKNIGILLTMYTGLRIGELCALQWKHIDLENEVIRIESTLQRIYLNQKGKKKSTKLLNASPKSKHSHREVPICSMLLPILQERKKEDKIYFLTGKKTPTEPRTYRAYYERFMKRNSIPYIKFHALRHTFATHCVESDCNYKILSDVLGHSSIKTTMDLYVHPQIEDKRNMIEEMYQTMSHYYSNVSDYK